MGRALLSAYNESNAFKSFKPLHEGIMIDLRHLRHVLALAEHRNFARAAEALHLRVCEDFREMLLV